MFLQYVSAICVHPFLFMAGYFFNTKKDLGETFHKKLRTMILPYYVFGIVYYLLWLWPRSTAAAGISSCRFALCSSCRQ